MLVERFDAGCYVPVVLLRGHTDLPAGLQIFHLAHHSIRGKLGILRNMCEHSCPAVFVITSLLPVMLTTLPSNVFEHGSLQPVAPWGDRFFLFIDCRHNKIPFLTECSDLPTEATCVRLPPTPSSRRVNWVRADVLLNRVGNPASSRSALPPGRDCEHPAQSKTKKADVAEHPKAFTHVGLLVIEPPARAGLLII